MTGRETSRHLLLRACRRSTVAEIGAGRARCPQADAARVAEIAVGMNAAEVEIKDREETRVRITGSSSCSRVQTQKERRETIPPPFCYGGSCYQTPLSLPVIL